MYTFCRSEKAMCNACVHLLSKLHAAEKHRMVGDNARREFWARTDSSSYVARRKRQRNSEPVFHDLVTTFSPSKSPTVKKLKVYRNLYYNIIK